MKTLIITSLIALAITTQAADIKQRPQPPKQSQPKSVSTPAKAMGCSQCTSVTVVSKRDLIVGKPGHGYRYVSHTVHQCAGCRETLARKAGTKAMELAHNCSAVGEKALCCATQSSRG